MHRFGYCFITAFGVWLALWLMFIGAHFLGQPTLEIQLHNTYLVVGSYSGQFFTFLPVLLFILLLDAGRRWAARSATVSTLR